MKWKKLKSRLVYKNKWMNLWEDKVIRPDGTRGIYSYVDTNGPAVFIVPMTDDDEVYLIRQFRYPTQVDSWEIVGGNVDDETIQVAAKRELLEETGLIAKKFIKVGTFQSMNGILTEIGHVFIAKNLTKSKTNKMAEEGITEVKKVSFSKVLLMIKQGEITDSQTQAAVLQAAIFLGKI